ncbi:transposable element Tcb1 transposase [Trichonephila clavipes]|nr:transposable element Tcb1 transposase [Trichonephila clavipes]
MPLRRCRRQYEQLSQFERGRIIGMMEVEWSARRVARQLYRSGGDWCSGGNLTAAEWNLVVFSDKSRFTRDDNRVRVWRPRGERLNLAFALQGHTTPTAMVKVCGVIAYNMWSPLVLINGIMVAQWFVHNNVQPYVLPLLQQLPGAIFNKTMLGLTWQGCHKTVSTPLSQYLGLPDPQICL